MKVVLFHPVLLPALRYGGVERFVVRLAKGLLERGHEVHVAALAGSQLPKGAHLLAMESRSVSCRDLFPLLPNGVDCIHFMAPPSAEALEGLPCAAVVSVHGNGKAGEKFSRNSVFVSKDHANRHGAQAFVHNGVDPEEFLNPKEWKTRQGGVFVSKTAWRIKNVLGAIRICSKAGVSLSVAGGNRPLMARMKVALEPNMEWLGSISDQEKASLMARSQFLIFPVLWAEPFGAVLVEALMSGTFVIASRVGGIPEIIVPEVGVLLPPPDSLSEEEQWVAALERKPRFDPEICRAYAVSKFHYGLMAEEFEKCYRKVVQGESLNPAVPVAPSTGGLL